MVSNNSTKTKNDILVDDVDILNDTISVIDDISIGKVISISNTVFVPNFSQNVPNKTIDLSKRRGRFILDR